MTKNNYSEFSKGFNSQKSLLYSALETEVQKLDIPLGEVTKSITSTATNSLYQPEYLGRKEFMNSYKEGRLKHEISLAKGNLTEVTRNIYDVQDPTRVNVLRKNVNENVSKFGLWQYVDEKRPWKDNIALEDNVSGTLVPERQVASALSSGLAEYQNLLHPKVYGEVQQKIDQYAPDIAKSVADLVPTRESTIDYLVKQTKDMTWDESIAHVEKLAVEEAMTNAHQDKKKAAEYLGNSVKTLNRKLAKFDLGETRSTQSKPDLATSDMPRLRAVIDEKQNKPDKMNPKPASRAEYFNEVAEGYDLAA